ncbi:MAG: succinate dehydrogenase, hydrophobic membrane anchor protein [Rickettsiaceae bacterium]|nr:MAG: succinate dehydrogenase, hydrophobic membrane anchor protein [Rickettsiaceae bacterium]
MDNLTIELQKKDHAKSAVTHWWHQRLSSIAMIPLLIWLMFFIQANNNKNFAEFLKNLVQPFNLITITLFLIIAFYHGMLGMRVIIEDYVPNIGLRNMLIVSLQSFCILTILLLFTATVLIII